MSNPYTYDNSALQQLFSLILQEHIQPDAWTWLSKQGDIGNTAAFNAAFVMMPRKTGKEPMSIPPERSRQLDIIRPEFSIKGWTAEHLGRVFLLIQADTNDKDRYVKLIGDLFLAAEMNELVALYSALPLLAYPELWAGRCAEGIRSNIGNVLEAIMYHNPYPAEQLASDAWNQLVMKAIFTEKQLKLIPGLEKRNNPELVRMLLDYARERGAAGRTVGSDLWQLAGQFAGPGVIADLKQEYQLN